MNTNKKNSKKSSHRLQLLNNLFISIIKHGFIKTTTKKAKMFRPFLEKKIVNMYKKKKYINHYISKTNTNYIKLHSKFRTLTLLNKGGYSRIIKIGHRSGDYTSIALIELK